MGGMGGNIVPGVEVDGRLHSPHRTGALLSWLALRHKRGRQTFCLWEPLQCKGLKKKALVPRHTDYGNSAPLLPPHIPVR